jgi:hypothetical protein
LLHRKVTALLGFEWRGPLDQYSTNIKSASSAKLLSRNSYQQLYGGIDSNSVTERLSDPNGLMAKVQERMANELACYAVPNDFLALRAARKLFPHVDPATTPGVGNADAIKSNIQHLHRYSAELTQTYNLFSAVQQDGAARLLSKAETAKLPTRCQRTKHLETGATLDGGGLTNDANYTIRAWTAVVAYLLSDYRFVYE